MSQFSREQIVAAASAAAAKTNGRLTMMELCRQIGMNKHGINRLFSEGWKEVRRLAGITKPNARGLASDDELLEKFHRLATELGTIPSLDRFERSGGACIETMRRRFGTAQARHERYRLWLQKNHPGSPLLPVLLSVLSRLGKKASLSGGAPTNLYGLRYAPTNEQGVIFLFGLLSVQLGFIVESIQSAYPDCQAKRCVDRAKQRWQTVRIEFEYSTSNFRDHRHDPAGCDLIVCWLHDWPACPLPVIELRAVLEELGCSANAWHILPVAVMLDAKKCQDPFVEKAS